MNFLFRRMLNAPRLLGSRIKEFSGRPGSMLGLVESRCPICHGVFAPDHSGPLAAACPACRASMPRRDAGYCPHCGELTADPHAPCTPCGRCLNETPPWADFRFHGVFEGALREALHRAKFSEDSACLALLASILDSLCRELPEADAIVPMPLHPARLRARGFNQCREMARLAAHRRKLPIRDDLLLRTRSAPPQTSLSRRDRLTNLNHVFAASPLAEGLRLLLVDDTATTGTSLRKGAEALIRAGAVRVDAVVIARAGRHDTGGY